MCHTYVLPFVSFHLLHAYTSHYICNICINDIVILLCCLLLLTDWIAIQHPTPTSTYGRYVFGDLFTAVFSSIETPPNSGMYNTERISYLCSNTTPLPCGTFTQLFAFGEDGARDLYIMTDNGTGVCGLCEAFIHHLYYYSRVIFRDCIRLHFVCAMALLTYTHIHTHACTHTHTHTQCVILWRVFSLGLYRLSNPFNCDLDYCPPAVDQPSSAPGLVTSPVCVFCIVCAVCILNVLLLAFSYD